VANVESALRHVHRKQVEAQDGCVDLVNASCG
jgi:hypothetical protein